MYECHMSWRKKPQGLNFQLRVPAGSKQEQFIIGDRKWATIENDRGELA